MVELISDFLHDLCMPFGPHSCITHTSSWQQGKMDKGLFGAGRGRIGAAVCRICNWLIWQATTTSCCSVLVIQIKDVCTITGGGHVKYKTKIMCANMVLNHHEPPEQLAILKKFDDGGKG